MKHEKTLVPIPDSHWEWERQGISFDVWKHQKEAQKSEAASIKYVMPGPGSYDYI